MELKVPTEMTIHRPDWVCGGLEINDGQGNVQFPLGEALLKNENEKLCCLGFGLRACGVPDGVLMNCSLPHDVGIRLQVDIPPFTVDVTQDSEFAKKAAKLNDNVHITQEQREAELTKLFKAAGIELKFTGKFDKEVAKMFKQRDYNISKGYRQT